MIVSGNDLASRESFRNLFRTAEAERGNGFDDFGTSGGRGGHSSSAVTNGGTVFYKKNELKTLFRKSMLSNAEDSLTKNNT